MSCLSKCVVVHLVSFFFDGSGYMQASVGLRSTCCHTYNVEDSFNHSVDNLKRMKFLKIRQHYTRNAGYNTQVTGRQWHGGEPGILLNVTSFAPIGQNCIIQI
ncbi:hypothetical protein HELRODRAFT_172921 [Helobdella robusta]|uniref:Secreted protein n=1 Tax=Helobdella robusta TaxID=6412 RepID=T1F649_HELRO|nr:hypothetical protein HELRODRAFT_172921 [Helobdella robusta]ESO03894.1 hypothetical protein HELRODRAFT_172921 [Helobdella robusta]